MNNNTSKNKQTANPNAPISNNLAYAQDKPITTPQDDKLKRKDFASQLAKSIANFEHNENFIIGLYGSWGSGKTSLINMVCHYIENEATSISADPSSPPPIIIKFNPWNFTSTDQLITQFFNQLQSKIKKCNNKVLNSLCEALTKYHIGLIATDILTMKFPTLNGIANKHIKNFNEEQNDLFTLKQKVEQALSADNCPKILVIIDDMDRVCNDEIKLIFKLVKSIADFPNMIYLLSFDKHIISSAIEDGQKRNGDEYLEKIIQVPFEIPMFTDKQIHTIFKDSLEKSFPQIKYDEITNTLEKCVYPFLKNIRDIYRLLNTFTLKHACVVDKLDFSDLLAITTLEVFEPKVFNWIKQNRYILTASNFDATMMIKNALQDLDADDLKYCNSLDENIFKDIKNIDKKTLNNINNPSPKTFNDIQPHIDEISKLSNYSSEIVLSSINILFPVFNNTSQQTNNHININYSSLVNSRTVGNFFYFNYYFVLYI